jgi:hypothetical protein
MPPEKPSEPEEEYFARLEFEQRRKAAGEERRKLGAEERKRLRNLHYMRCPKCGPELVAIAYRGIELDNAPPARGCG